MKYLEIRTFQTRSAIENEAEPTTVSLDFLCLSRSQMQFFYQTIEKWLSAVGHSELLSGDSQQKLLSLVQNGQQKEANTASLLRFVLRSADYTKLSTEHLFVAQRVDDRLGVDIKRSDGYIAIEKDDWEKIRDVVHAAQGFKMLSLAPFLKIVDCPLEEIPSPGPEKPE